MQREIEFPVGSSQIPSNDLFQLSKRIGCIRLRLDERELRVEGAALLIQYVKLSQLSEVEGLANYLQGLLRLGHNPGPQDVQRACRCCEALEYGFHFQRR